MGICERINKNEAGTKVLASPLSKENAPRKLQNEEFWSQYRLDLCN